MLKTKQITKMPKYIFATSFFQDKIITNGVNKIHIQNKIRSLQYPAKLILAKAYKQLLRMIDAEIKK